MKGKLLEGNVNDNIISPVSCYHIFIDIDYRAYYYVYKEVYNMRTNIDLDDELVAEAFKYTDVKTKKELVRLSLTEFIENRKRRNLADLRGNIAFDENYDYKAMRRNRK